MDIKNLYVEYLNDIKLMQLATCVDGQPWLCNVWYVMDDDGRIFWISRETRRHSSEIEKNPKVACTFHKWFGDGLGQPATKALVVAGLARRLEGWECDKPFELYSARHPSLAGFQSKQAFLNDEGHHYFYEITPTEIVWWDEENFSTQPRQEVL